MPELIDSSILAAYALKLLKAAIGIGLLLALGYYIDMRRRHTFAQSMETIAKDPRALAQFYGLRWIAMALALGMLVGCSAAQAATPFPTKYDRHIKAAVETNWPHYPFPMAWKAQLWQESRLDPNAVSPVGARGLAQFMPGTWKDMVRDMKLGDVSPSSEVAIDAGAAYMARLTKAWSSPRPAEDRQKLARASYNAGTGNLLKAQNLCLGRALYDDIVKCLPAVTGEHSRETIGYVRNIDKWRVMMEAGL